MAAIDCDLLICEVQKRPALYDLQLREYCDKNVKDKLWAEVYGSVVPGWHELSPGEKNEKGRCLLKQSDHVRRTFSVILHIAKIH